MAIENLPAVLKETSLGNSLSEDELNQVLAAGTVLEVGKGNILIEEGVDSHTILLLLEGEAEVIKGKDAQQLAVCGKGSVLGEIGVLLNIPQIATVRARQDCVAFAFNPQDSPSVKLGVPLAPILASRLQHLTNELGRLGRLLRNYLLQERQKLKQGLAQVQNDSKKLAGQKHVEHLTESNQALKQQLHLLHL